MTERSAARPQRRLEAIVSERAPPHILGPKIKFAGTIVHAGRVEVYGTMRGRIRALEISIKEGGSFTGEAEANTIFNAGEFSGHLRSRRLLLSERSSTGGDITTVKIGIEPGGKFPDFAHVITVDEAMIPEQTIEDIHAEIERGGRSRPKSAEPTAPSDEPATTGEPEAPRQLPFLVSV